MITIVVLLILAGVAINLAVDSDGLFSKAGEAANKCNTSVATEGSALENLMQMANSGNNKGIENFARNVCKEKGIDFDKEFNSFMNDFK